MKLLLFILLTFVVQAANASGAIKVESCTARFVLDNVDMQLQREFADILKSKGYIDQAGNESVSASEDDSSARFEWNYGKPGFLEVRLSVSYSGISPVPVTDFIEIRHFNYDETNSGIPVSIDTYYKVRSIVFGLDDREASQKLLGLAGQIPTCTEL